MIKGKQKMNARSIENQPTQILNLRIEAAVRNRRRLALGLLALARLGRFLGLVLVTEVALQPEVFACY